MLFWLLSYICWGGFCLGASTRGITGAADCHCFLAPPGPRQWVCECAPDIQPSLCGEKASAKRDFSGGRRAVSLRFRIRSATLGRGCMSLVASKCALGWIAERTFRCVGDTVFCGKMLLGKWCTMPHEEENDIGFAKSVILFSIHEVKHVSLA